MTAPAPIVRINEFRAAEGKEAELLAFLRAVVDVVTQCEGCVDCELLVAHEAPGQLAIVETWVTIAAHQAAAGAIPKEKLAEVRTLIAEPPRGRYYQRA